MLIQSFSGTLNKVVRDLWTVVFKASESSFGFADSSLWRDCGEATTIHSLDSNANNVMDFTKTKESLMMYFAI